MKDSYDQLPSRLQIKESKKELKKEEEEVELVKKEKQQLLEQLAERAKLEDQEKRDILAKLKENDDRLHAAQREVELLRNQLRSKQMGKRDG